jgi:hypothetical protein
VGSGASVDFASYRSTYSRDLDGIEADPLMADLAGGDLSLTVGSPAIDAGAVVPLTRASDFYGVPVPHGSAPDIGAFEFNRDPVANAGQDQTVLAGSGPSAAVQFDGRGSSDPDGDPLTYSWSWNGGSAVGAQPVVTLPLGSTVVTLTVYDGFGGKATDTVTIQVNDGTAPVISSLTPSPAQLWPANHKMVRITLSAIVTDNVDPAPITRIVSVESNEPINDGGDGDTAPDWTITGDMTLELRAERSGNGNARIYTITVESIDGSGNRSAAATTVVVPHDKGR